MLAGRKIRTGDRRIVAAGPAAERDLQHEHGEAADGELAQAPFRAPSASRRSGVERQPPQQSPSVVRPPSKCAVTISGCSSSVTVSAPSAPCTQTTTKQSATGSSGWPRSLRLSQRPNQQARDDQPQRAREVAVHHLVQRLGEMVGGLADTHARSSPANRGSRDRHRSGAPTRPARRRMRPSSAPKQREAPEPEQTLVRRACG